MKRWTLMELSQFNFLNRINRDFRINFCYVKMKKKKKKRGIHALE